MWSRLARLFWRFRLGVGSIATRVAVSIREGQGNTSGRADDPSRPPDFRPHPHLGSEDLPGRRRTLRLLEAPSPGKAHTHGGNLLERRAEWSNSEATMSRK